MGFVQEFAANATAVPNLLLSRYQQLGLNEEELVILLRLMKQKGQQESLTLTDAAEEFSCDLGQASLILAPFLAKNLINQYQGADGGAFYLDGLFNALWDIWSYDKASSGKKASEKTEKNSTYNLSWRKIYATFEKEMARPLSPIQNEQLQKWLEQDKLSPELILEALRRAVLLNKNSFAYIDKILLSWQSQGLQTLEAVKANDNYGNTGSGSKKSRKPLVKSEYSSVYDNILK
ncbi:MAG: DnaD domain protein [Clostridiales bacterium]|jgi:DNA replication protein|nr:DnaD domain protein [Clostridiales bacterium]